MSTKHKDYDFLLYRIEALERRIDGIKSSNESELVNLLLKLLEKNHVEAQPPPPQTQHQQLPPKTLQCSEKKDELTDTLLTFARRRTMT